MKLDHVADQIAEDAAHLDAAHHRLLANIRLFAADGDWHMQGFRSCAQWLSWRVGWTPGTAREHVRVATALGSLPEIDRALARGELSYCKVRALTRVATPANEHVLLEQARLTTGHQLEQICRKYASVQRHDAAATRPEDDRERRYVRRRDTGDGMVLLEAALHPDEAAVVWAALERIASERCRAPTTSAASTPAESTPSKSPMQATAEHAHAAIAEPPATASAAMRDAAMDVFAGTSGRASATGMVSVSERTGDAVRSDAFARTLAEASSLMAPVPGRPGAAVAGDVSAGTWAHAASVATPGAQPHGDQVATHVAAVTSTMASATAGRAASVDVPAGTPAHAASVASPDDRLHGHRVPTHVAARTSRASTARHVAFDRADALVQIAQAVVRGETPDRSPTEIMISIPIETLQDRDASDPTNIACCADGTGLSSHAARRLACDAGLIAMLEDANGAAIAMGRKRRTISGSMKRALLRRDRTCRFPGCQTRVFLEGHHVEHWVDGGETELSNILALCSHHHRFVHEHGFTIEMREDGAVVARDPHGRAVPELAPSPAPRLPDLGWPNIRRRNERLGITADTIECWDGTPVDYPELVDWIVRTDERAATRSP